MFECGSSACTECRNTRTQLDRGRIAVCCNLRFEEIYSQKSTPSDGVFVVNMSNGSCKGLECVSYCVQVDRTNGRSPTASWKALIRREIASKLYWRFRNALSSSISASNTTKAPLKWKVHLREDKDVMKLPGSQDIQFLSCLRQAVGRKFDLRLCPCA